MKTPVTLICGFLGFGKTTFMLQWIETMQRLSQKCAVIVNELGPLDDEESIVSTKFPNVPVITVLDGCFCCSFKQHLFQYVQSALQSKPDHLIIELNGVANPLEVVDALSEPKLRELVYVDHIFSVVDARVFDSESTSMKNIVLEGLKVADQIIINKFDLIDRKNTQTIEKQIELVSAAPKHWTTEAKIEPHLLESWITTSNEMVSLRVIHAMMNRTGDSFMTDGITNNPAHLSHTGIRSAQLHVPNHPFITAIKIEGWLKKYAISMQRSIMQSGKIIRAKGYIRLSGDEDVFLYQFINGQHEWQATTYSGESYIVLIGKDLNEDEIKTDFQHHFPAW